MVLPQKIKKPAILPVFLRVEGREKDAREEKKAEKWVPMKISTRDNPNVPMLDIRMMRIYMLF